MKIVNTIISFALMVLVTSCDLVSPAEVENPNVVTDDFVNSSNAMTTWVNGTNATLAENVGCFCEYMEILSDNYYNNYTRSSKTFDVLGFSYISGEVNKLATYVGELVEMADFGLNTVAPKDAATTDAQRFNLLYVKAYAYILGGENFVALPLVAKGDVVTWQEMLKAAVSVLDEASKYAQSDDDHAFIETLYARAYYKLGDKTNAVAHAKKSLGSYSKELVHNVTFDGANGVTNSINEYIGSYMFQPLSRLDFLDPKYPYATYWEAPICIAKSEENYLILAEAALADKDLSGARDYLKQLTALVAKRPKTDGFIDKNDERDNGGAVHYANGEEYLVAASASDTPRAGLVRKHGAAGIAYSLPTVSGTSVSDEMIDSAYVKDLSAGSHDSLLELVYLMRQEIFIAEGRRASDLGIRMPLSEVEAALHSDLPASYTESQIPSFIPGNGELDAFTIDEATKTVTIKHNMNRVIVDNKTSDYIVPFE